MEVFSLKICEIFFGHLLKLSNCLFNLYFKVYEIFLAVWNICVCECVCVVSERVREEEREKTEK